MFFIYFIERRIELLLSLGFSIACTLTPQNAHSYCLLHINKGSKKSVND